jgi:hypothetical protein
MPRLADLSAELQTEARRLLALSGSPLFAAGMPFSTPTTSITRERISTATAPNGSGTRTVTMTGLQESNVLDDDRLFAAGVVALIERATPAQRLTLARHALASLALEDRIALLAPTREPGKRRGRPSDPNFKRAHRAND